MKIALTGYNGYLASKLREYEEFTWVEDLSNTDLLIHMGSPIFTHAELSEHDAQVMYQYVRETIKIVDRYPNKIIFASTTGVNDIKTDHSGSTSYNLAKLYLENYILNNCDSPLVLRIGTIISRDINEVKQMKSDRVQQRILNGDYSNIPLIDEYLDVDTFKDITIEAIKQNKSGILEYPLNTIKLSELIRLGKQND